MDVLKMLKENKKSGISLAVSLLLSLGTGLAAGLLTADSQNTYANLYRPPLAPPGWIFPIVWTILYLLMGAAAWLVYESGHIGRGEALRLYLAQLLVNAMWPVVFFSYGAYWLAFVLLLVLIYLVFQTWQYFRAIVPLAGALLVPYLVWLLFAAYLNLAIALKA